MHTNREHTQTAKKPLNCTVESVLPFGVFVLLPDGIRGYIRRRELTLSGDTDPREVVRVGEQIRAIVMVERDSERTLELSVRATLGDPWLQFAQQYRVGDVVAATVKGLYPEGVRAEVIPGVDGQIPSRDLKHVNQALELEDFLWLDDRVEAVITAIDPSRKFLGLSMRRRLEQFTLAEAVKEQIDHIGQASGIEDDAELGGEAQLLFEPELIQLDGPILIVEDREEIRKPLRTWLEEHGCEVEGAASAQEAIELCKAHDFVFGLFDLDIPGMNGVSLIQRLRELHNEIQVAIMSGPDLIMEQWPNLQPLGIVACFPKPLDLDEVAQTLQQISRGEAPQLAFEPAETDLGDGVSAFQSLAGNLLSKRQSTERFQVPINRLLDDTGIDKIIMFHLDPTSNNVTIIVEAGPQQVNMEAVYRLSSSPVKDVIHESSLCMKGEVSQDRSGRFRNLLPLLAFQSFIGIPLEAGGRREHALFLFDRRPNAFRQLAIQQALNTAVLLQTVLERQLLEQRLETAGGMLLSGQLSSAFGHEVYNKVTSLDLQMKNLSRILDYSEEQSARTIPHAALSQVKASVEETATAVTALRRIVTDFQRLLRSTDEQRVDVKQALENAAAQVRPIAERSATRIYLDFHSDLPLTQGNSIHMQHVFLNLMLNAIQQMGDLDQRRRILRVSTCAMPDEAQPHVQIRFSDKGPGIHQRLWEMIFSLGFTTRDDGSGLGLFIARGLVEAAGGRISVEDSLITMGTTFLVELPIAG